MIFFGTEIPLFRIGVVLLIAWCLYQWVDAFRSQSSPNPAEWVAEQQAVFTDALLDLAGGDSDQAKQEFEEE